tara:strand:+ start:119 stop:856 length:738 start_codon:yes stop_codon:yes gene_type:complete
MKKRDIVKGLINEKFASKAQQRFFYAMSDKDTKKGREFKKWSKEFSDDTDFDDIPEKVKQKNNPKIKKGELMEYINFKKNGGVRKLTKNDILREQYDGIEAHIIEEMTGQERRDVVRYLEDIRESGLINMFGAAPILNWTKDDLHRWLYGMNNDIESLESRIESLKDEDDYEDDNEYEIDSLEEQLEIINRLLGNKQKIRDILIRAALTRIENGDGNTEIRRVQRLFEKLAKESWMMWTTGIHGS